MLRILLLLVVVYVGTTSPELRSFAAKGLRMSADWIEPKQSTEKNPKTFQIPNPFYDGSLYLQSRLKLRKDFY